MARAVDPSVCGPVVELGPGTGPVTEALIHRGVPQERLVLVEFDPDFCKLLARRYPKATIVEGDAYALARSLAPVMHEKAAAIVSSLPLLTKPERQRMALLAEAFELMSPEAVFVQFTYGLGSPVPRVDDEFLPVGFHANVSAPVWLNFPPARVWTYRAARAGDEATIQEPKDFIVKLKLGTEKFGDEWREKRDRVRREFLVRTEKAKAEFRERSGKVKISMTRHKGSSPANDARRPPLDLFKKARPDKRHPRW